MARTIQTLLDSIMNAKYGEEVRSSIHDSIAMCYSDVSTSETTAAQAAEAARLAAETTRQYGDSARQAAGIASTNAAAAESAASNANSAASDAASAASDATSAAADARSAISDARSAISDVDTARRTALSAADLANTNADLASTAAASAREAAGSVGSVITTAQSAAANCVMAKDDANAAAVNARDATTAAKALTDLYTGLSVSYSEVGPTGSASVTESIVDGHKNFHFVLKQGATGAANIVKGSAYATIADLKSAITNPAIGDQYNVGTTTPYHIYRWTGDSSAGDDGWEDQGTIGVSIVNLENSEIDTLWNGSSVSGNSKYINQTGLLYLIGQKIQAALNGKVNAVSGKGLTTYDFDATARGKVNLVGTATMTTSAQTITEAINELNSGKVNTDGSKVLSTNDFTTAYMNKVDANATKIGTTTMTTTAQTLTGAVSELDGDIGNVNTLSGFTATNLTAAANELMTDIGDVSNLSGFTATNLTGAANELKTLNAKRVLYFSNLNTTGATNNTILRIPASGTNSLIDSNTVVLECTFANPAVIQSNISWSSTTGYITFTGTASAATTANVVLGTKGN